jgi:dolichyl-phosphate-mannose-protein mannosyltransferase
MAARSAVATMRDLARSRTIPWVLLSYLAIGLAALLPRALDLGVFLTGDEANFWLRRSDIFLGAIRSGNWAATAISTHPGVTTMWLGSAGLLLQDALLGSGIVRDGSFATFLALTRLPTALVHSAGIVVGYGLLRKLLRPGPAFLAALLWAADPFIIGYSRVLHVDGLAGTFATLSLLAACLYWHHDPSWRWLILSGVTGGLAILSKSPALALLPIVGLLALAAAWRPLTTDQRPPTNTSHVTRHASRVTRYASFVALLAWGAVVALTIFALWPALWVGPLRAYAQVQLGIEAEGAEPHMLGNFFQGRADDAPGPLFYPVALALRLTPWALLGLLALPLALRRAQPSTRRDLAALASFVVFFILALSVFPKKFNRYLIPAFPAVDILAAIGLVALIAFCIDQTSRLMGLRIAVPPDDGLATAHHRTGRGETAKYSAFSILHSACFTVVALAAMINAAWYHPYGIVYFNQALGGAAMGTRTFLAGWGEGFEQVAAWLNGQPDITGVVTVSPMGSSLQPYMRKGAHVSGPAEDSLPRKSGYVVVYIRQVQDGQTVPPFDQFYGKRVPLHVVTLHGVGYAWIYQAPPEVAKLRPAAFGSAIHLRGFDPAGLPQRGQPLVLRLVWEPRAAPAADYMLFAHLLAPDGGRVAQVDLPLPSSSWTPGRYQATELPIAVPADAPPGVYRLAIGLYEPPGGRRLPLTAVDALDPAVDGPEALILAEIELK